MRERVRLAFILLLAALLALPAHAAPIDDVASGYAELSLSALLLASPSVEIDPSLAPRLAAARAARRDGAAIHRDAGRLLASLDGLRPARDRLLAMRQRSLRARLVSLQFAFGPAGPRLDLAEEIHRRFGFRPEFRPLSAYDPALARLDRAMPGTGSLAERIDAMRREAAVPPERIEAVFRAALAECRRRTGLRIPLGAESVEVRFVDDPMTPASAQYAGNGRSVVRISRIVPTDVDRLLQHACHEAYPGHHVHFLGMDRALFRARGWVEYGVAIDSPPFFPASEAISEYGVGLAFPVEERIAFARDVLFPLAGRTMRNEPQWRAFLSARADLLGASATVARDILTGAIDEATARERLIRYRLQTPAAAAQTVRMISAGLGPYLIASDFGWYAVDRTIRRRPVAEQWRLLRRIQTEPMLLEDILRL